jgi:hypothetical protein
MGGYNSSIFAYGQTGAGKTYTMQGPLSAALQDDNPEVCVRPQEHKDSWHKPAILTSTHSSRTGAAATDCSLLIGPELRSDAEAYMQQGWHAWMLCVLKDFLLVCCCRRGAWRPGCSSTCSQRSTRRKMKT